MNTWIVGRRSSFVRILLTIISVRRGTVAFLPCRKSADDTQTLLQSSHGQFDKLANHFSEVNQLLTENTSPRKTVGEMMSGVRHSSQEQSEHVDQVNRVASQIDQLIRPQAATAEEGASAAEELNAQAFSMQEAVQALLRLAGPTSTS